jgi:hypothetical protein
LNYQFVSYLVLYQQDKLLWWHRYQFLCFFSRFQYLQFEFFWLLPTESAFLLILHHFYKSGLVKVVLRLTKRKASSLLVFITPFIALLQALFDVEFKGDLCLDLRHFYICLKYFAQACFNSKYIQQSIYFQLPFYLVTIVIFRRNLLHFHHHSLRENRYCFNPNLDWTNSLSLKFYLDDYLISLFCRQLCMFSILISFIF